MSVRALIGREGGTPPIVLWLAVSRGWGFYVSTRRRRLTVGPAFGGWRLARR